MKQPWLRAATALVFCRYARNSYKVLMVKRKPDAKFMPSAVVFPGGVYEIEDSYREWITVFPQLQSYSTPCTATYPSIIQDSKERISDHLGLRICALRELFEESGLLLSERLEAGGVRKLNVRSFPASDPLRQSVQENPLNFIKVFQSLGAEANSSSNIILPAIWALKDWNTWLTPTFPIKNGVMRRRYDTQFYSVIIDDEIQLHPDLTEVTRAQFWSLDELFSGFLAGEVKLAPPQVKEIKEILDYETLNDLENEVSRRHSLGTYRIYPITIESIDALMRILPGDPLYPEVPDLYHYRPIKLNLTIDEIESLYPANNRTVAMKKNIKQYWYNTPKL